MNNAPWLSIIGIGEDGLDGISSPARALIEEATTLVGGERHLAFVPDGAAERLTWESPLSKTLDAIAARKNTPVVVLASGDPMQYGIGVALTKRFGIEDIRILPVASAVSLACARLGWDMAETEVLTLHGRPLALLYARLRPGARTLILSEDGETPAQVAGALINEGYGQSPMTVFEHLGGEKENRRKATAHSWGEQKCADLNIIALECRADDDARPLPLVPGLADDAFLHDGQITKRVVRAATLAALMPLPRTLLWDVGAGAGSVAIEWLRAEPTARAVAFERGPARAERITENATRLGVPRLHIITGEAPTIFAQALKDSASPDALFLGGGVSIPGMIEA
ncbi:MAG: precorrin-6y C5,15-methyltransferase (decarboxylating) subunit CbiE, partial [Rhodospirillaceae bacterium]|nr:precorrin-6y C5,15-methyltransferase (decarboxylating) subunit CbiE [Rhodospirillaceae bacterium]